MSFITLSSKPDFDEVLSCINLRGGQGLVQNPNVGGFLEDYASRIQKSAETFYRTHSIRPLMHSGKVSFSKVYTALLATVKDPVILAASQNVSAGKAALYGLSKTLESTIYTDLCKLAGMCRELDAASDLKRIYSEVPLRWNVLTDPYRLQGLSVFHYLESHLKKRLTLEQLSLETVGNLFDAGDGKNLYSLSIPQVENFLILSKVASDTPFYRDFLHTLLELEGDFYTALAYLMFDTKLPLKTQRAYSKEAWFSLLGMRKSGNKHLDIPDILRSDIDTFVAGTSEAVGAFTETHRGYKFTATTLFGRKFNSEVQGGYSARTLLLSGLAGSSLDMWGFFLKDIQDIGCDVLMFRGPGLLVTCTEKQATRLSDVSLELRNMAGSIPLRLRVEKCE